MSETVIRTENLSKLYRIGEHRGGYKTLREKIVNTFSAPFRQLISKPQTSNLKPQSEFIWALKDISFEVKRGEVLGIIGQNGAGKTTLLKLLSRITEPTDGWAEISGRVGSLLEVGTGFHPELTGRENIYLNGAILGMKKAELDRKFDEIVAFAEIEKFIDTPVKRYSSGMHVRLAFAVAAHLEPEILLVDEVLAVGDNAFQKKCLGKVGEVKKEGRTVLFVSHNMAAINTLCDVAFLLDGGRVGFSGDVERVVSHYLASNASSEGKVCFEDNRNSIASIEMVGVLDSTGRYTPVLPIHQDFSVRIQCRIRQRLEEALIAFGLIAADGTKVFVSSHRDKDRMHSAALLPGVYQADVRVPGNFLNSGTYCLNVQVRGRAEGDVVKPHAQKFNALSFTVEDTGLMTFGLGGRRRGVVTPVLDWEVEEIRAEAP